MSGVISGKVKHRREMKESRCENGEMQQKQKEQRSQEEVKSHRWTERVRLFSPCGQPVTEVDTEVSACVTRTGTSPPQTQELLRNLKTARVEHLSAKNIKHPKKVQNESVPMVSLPQTHNTDAVMRGRTWQMAGVTFNSQLLPSSP